jgi:hypothetical protein
VVELQDDWVGFAAFDAGMGLEVIEDVLFGSPTSRRERSA